jgi:hypothetical protein
MSVMFDIESRFENRESPLKSQLNPAGTRATFEPDSEKCSMIVVEIVSEKSEFHW